jgi:hypothetical protein
MNPAMASVAPGFPHNHIVRRGSRLNAGLCFIIFNIFFIFHSFAQTPPETALPQPTGRVTPPADTPLKAPETVILADTINDTIIKRVHSPLKATMLSAALPGMGQLYNGRWWKVPFIYAGYGGIFYAVNFNNTQYQKIRRAWIARIDGNPNTIDEYPLVSTDRLQRGVNYYRRNLELTYILAVGLYMLNILDATVDAHLLDFDVGEDLSLNIRPVIIPSTGGFNGAAPGIGLSFRF